MRQSCAGHHCREKKIGFSVRPASLWDKCFCDFFLYSFCWLFFFQCKSELFVILITSSSSSKCEIVLTRFTLLFRGKYYIISIFIFDLFFPQKSIKKYTMLLCHSRPVYKIREISSNLSQQLEKSDFAWLKGINFL